MTSAFSKDFSSLDAMETASALPTVVQLQVPFEGLKTVDVFSCTGCNGTLNSKRAHVVTHSNAAGHGMVPSMPNAKAQRFNNSKAPYFRVDTSVPTPTPAQLTEAQNWMADIEAIDFNTDTSLVSPALPRMTSAWLKATKFMDLVHALNPQDLVHLVASPAKDEFAGLGRTVIAYARLCTSEIDDLDHNTRCRLNSADPQKK